MASLAIPLSLVNLRISLGIPVLPLENPCVSMEIWLLSLENLQVLSMIVLMANGSPTSQSES